MYRPMSEFELENAYIYWPECPDVVQENQTLCYESESQWKSADRGLFSQMSSMTLEGENS